MCQCHKAINYYLCFKNLLLQSLHFYLLFFPFISVYIKATAGLCILALVTDVIATVLTGLGLRTQNHNLKYKFYRRAVLVMLVACKYFSILIYLLYSINVYRLLNTNTYTFIIVDNIFRRRRREMSASRINFYIDFLFFVLFQ